MFILLAAVITVIFSGIVLESYKRHRDLQGVASAVAGEIYSVLHIVEKRGTPAHFARLLAELEAGRDVEWTDVTGGDPAQDDPVIKAHLERLGSLPDNTPERIATFYTYLRGIRIDVQNLAKGVFKEKSAQAAIIRADLGLWADASQLGKDLWADLRKTATSQWWLFRFWHYCLSACQRGIQRAIVEYNKRLTKKGAGNVDTAAMGAPQPTDATVSTNAEALPDSPAPTLLFAPPYQELVSIIAADIDNQLLPSVLPKFCGNREQALRYLLIDFRSAVVLERASRFLFGSQIDAIIFLRANNGRATTAELQRYYLAGVQNAADFYQNYAFDGWLEFMVNQGLLSREGDIVSLLPSGRGIINYMQQRGYLRARPRG
jgi:hypothetical protein